MLYEMLTGELPFGGDYEQAVFYSIINEEPKYPDDIPTDLQPVLQRALAKEKEDRYQSVGDLLRDLETTPQTGMRTLATPAAKARAKSMTGILAAGVIGLALLVVLFIYLQISGDMKAIRLTNPRQITRTAGLEHFLTWSPDGGRLAFESEQSGNWDIGVQQLAGGEPPNLTANNPDSDQWPRWSPDGSQIAFMTFRDWDNVSVNTMPAIGGTPRKVVSHLDSRTNLRWSPDGSELAYLVKDSTPIVRAEIRTIGTGEKRQVVLPGAEYERLYLSWSSNEILFAYIDAVNKLWRAPSSQLRLANISDSENWPLTEQRHFDFYPTWSADGKSVYYLSNRGGTNDLWQQRLDEEGKQDGGPVQLTFGLGIISAEFSPDGTKLAYAKGGQWSNIWRAPIPGVKASPTTWADAKQLTFGSAMVSTVNITPDGKSVLFDSNRTGNSDIWLIPVTGGELRQLTSASSSEEMPKVSPDGEWIAFNSDRSGAREIWIMPFDGGAARQVTSDGLRKHWPRWAPDGQTLAYIAQNNIGTVLDIWLVPAKGGEATKIQPGRGNEHQPLWWPDGQSLVFMSRRGPNLGVWRTSISGDQPEPISKPGLKGIWEDEMVWSTDKTEIYLIMQRNGTRNIWSLSVQDGSVRPLTDLKERTGRTGRTLAMDGEFLYFTWHENASDIWVMDVERED